MATRKNKKILIHLSNTYSDEADGEEEKGLFIYQTFNTILMMN